MPLLRVTLTPGAFDAARKARFAEELQEAAQAAAPDGRLVVTSCVIHEVPEGQWAQNGAIRRLPEVTARARFEHLTALLAQR